MDLIRKRRRKNRYDSRGYGNGSPGRPGVPDGEAQRRKEGSDDDAVRGTDRSDLPACECDDHGCISCTDDTEPAEIGCGIDEAGYEEDEMNGVF